MGTPDLTGKVVAITGGGRGIGAETARQLVAAGARVGLGDLDVEVAEQLAEQLGSNAVATRLDVRDPESFDAFLDLVEGTFGPVDVLVNNAGIMLVGDFAKEDQRSTDLMIDVNVKGVVNGCRAAIPRFRQRNDGHLVNVASMAGKIGIPNLATYVATKHAVVGLSDALRVELADDGIAVSTVMPNVVNTELGSGSAKNLIPPLQVAEVAEVILHLIRTRQNEATVPRWLGKLSKVAAPLPSRGRQAVEKVAGAHRTFTQGDPERRKSYEERARNQ